MPAGFESPDKKHWFFAQVYNDARGIESIDRHIDAVLEAIFFDPKGATQ